MHQKKNDKQTLKVEVAGVLQFKTIMQNFNTV